jgi:hypothetical protein
MSFVSKGHSINCNSVTLGGIYANTTSSINITHSDPLKKILINGVEPSAGGGGGVTDPLNLNNINAAVAMTTPSITPPAAGGGLVIKANELSKPVGVGETLNISASTIETVDGDISTSGTGSVRVQGSGFISCNTTITANGNISTGVSADIVSGKNLYFNGQDLYKSYPGVVPPIADKTYKDYKGLVATGDNAIFTGSPVFRQTVKVQTTDGAIPPTLTDQITLNNNGTVQCSNANIVTALTVGTITCDNGGLNECKARVFNTRTSGTAGWNITQALEEAAAPGNAANNILQFAATQAQAAGIPTQVYITASDFDPTQGDLPSVIIDPVTTASGGRVHASQFITGTTSGRYVLKQDIGGPLNDDLQITAPTGGSEVIFKSNIGGDLLQVGTTVTCNAPLLASGTVNVGSTLGVVGDVSLSGATSAIRFGLYSFRPRQFSLTRTLTISATNDTVNFTNMAFNCRSDTWTDVNNGGSVSMYNALLEGYYKCTITQTGLSSAGNFNFCDLIFDYVLHLSIQTAPDIIFTQPGFGYRAKPTNQATPTIEIDHLNVPVQSQPVFVKYPGQSSGETMPIEVRLTKMDY